MTFFNNCLNCAENEVSDRKPASTLHQQNSIFNNDPIVPVAEFFTNATRKAPKVSHDGQYIAFLAQGQNKNKNLQVEIQPLALYLQGLNEGRKVVVTHPTHDIRGYTWSLSSSKYIIYYQDKNGDENLKLYRTNIHTLETICLTPFEDVNLGEIHSSYIYQSKSKPNHCVVSLNKIDKSIFDLYKLDLETAEIELHMKNPGNAIQFLCNDNLDVLVYAEMTKDSSIHVYCRGTAEDNWRNILTVDANETMQLEALTDDGKSLLYQCSEDEACTVLKKYTIESGAVEVLSRGKVDIADIKLNPQTNTPEAVCYDTGRRNWVILDEKVKDDLNTLVSLDDQADIEFFNQTVDNKFWVVEAIFGNKPPCYYLYERERKKLSKLFSTHPNLEKYKFGKCESVNYNARDGLQLQGYFTYPFNFSPDVKYPMVLHVHGGPWHRDKYQFNITSQWLANRGYVVFQPNYRGSTGFTKELLVKSYKQWGKTMHTDLLDSVDMAVAKGFIDREHVAIFGGSYGGYAALCGVTLTPDFFTCSVDIVGPSSLITLIKSFPSYWDSMIARFRTRIGDEVNEAEMLAEVSPLTHIHKIVKPLMIAQGKNDPRVTVAESEQIVDAIEKTSGNVYYVLYPNEGHGFSTPVNRIDFFSKAELFLNKFMGPKARSQQGLSLDVNVEGSTAIVKVVGRGL